MVGEQRLFVRALVRGARGDTPRLEVELELQG